MISNLGLVALNMQKFRKETFWQVGGVMGQKKNFPLYLGEDRRQEDRTGS